MRIFCRMRFLSLGWVKQYNFRSQLLGGLLHVYQMEQRPLAWLA
jgi:hypothetical protein